MEAQAGWSWMKGLSRAQSKGNPAHPINLGHSWPVDPSHFQDQGTRQTHSMTPGSWTNGKSSPRKVLGPLPDISLPINRPAGPPYQLSLTWFSKAGRSTFAAPI